MTNITASVIVIVTGGGMHRSARMGWFTTFCGFSIVVGLLTSGEVVAAGSDRIAVKVWMEAVDSPRTLTFMMAFAGASREAAKVVYDDFMKRIGGQKAPKIQMVNDEIELNGKKSGLKVTSYSPLRLSYQGRVWSATPGQSGDEVYFELIKLFSNPRKTVRHYPWTPEIAHASNVVEDGAVGARIGAVSGAIGGSIIGWLAGLGLGGWAGWSVGGAAAVVLGATPGGAAVIGTGLAIGALFAYLGSQGGAMIGGAVGIAAGGVMGAGAGGIAGVLDDSSSVRNSLAENLVRDSSSKDCNSIQASCNGSITTVEGNGALITVKKDGKSGKNLLDIKIGDKSVDLSKADAKKIQELSEDLLNCEMDGSSDTLTERARNACNVATGLATAGTTVPASGGAAKAGKVQ